MDEILSQHTTRGVSTSENYSGKGAQTSQMGVRPLN